MKSLNISKNIKSSIFLLALMTFLPYGMQAQRIGHSASRGGHSMSRPAPNRSHSTMGTRQNKTRQMPKKSINGGHNKIATRPSINKKPTRPSNSSKIATRPSVNEKPTRPSNNSKIATRPSINKKTTRPSNSSKIATRPSAKNKVTDKKTNIHNGNKNINIDNSKNINISGNNVRRSSVNYHRPPYRYGGHMYYCHRPYYYHPYRPFYWGSTWHPWGFFIRTITTTAILISINNQAYHYESGVYYVESNGGYTVVQAPVGATVKVIPKEAEKVAVNETTNNYYYGGDFYEKNGEDYTVVPATAGTIVPSLPEGGEEEKVGDVTYVKFGGVYYQPIQVDGKNMYEIVEVREDE